MKQYLKTVAEMMAIAARTAPKSAGQDFVIIEIIDGDTLSKIANEMIAFGEKSGKGNFDRDAKSVKDSGAVLLVGIKDAKPLGLNCGACGYDDCKEIKPHDGKEFKGPHCAYRLLDMGIALGSAAKTANILNADSRMMYRVGVVARQMKLIDADLVIGIPISATGKSIYFDR